MSKGTGAVAIILAFAGGYFVRGYVGGTAGSGEPEGLVAAPSEGASDRVRVPVGTSPSKGPKDAKVTIVEFSDFQWPFCSRVGPTLEELMKEFPKDIRFVFKQSPLPMHNNAQAAAEASMAAGEQGKFWEMYDKLFANNTKLDRPSLEQYAQQIGLDVQKFKDALDSRRFQKQVEMDKGLAAQVGVTGTPAFFINGKFLNGAQPKDAFEKIIKDEIAYADTLIKKGITSAQVYDRLMKDAKPSVSAVANKGPQQPQQPGQRPPGAPDPNLVYKVPVGNSPFKGPKDAKVTIVEWSDFQWPFCSRVRDTLKQVEQTYPKDVKVVFKFNPLPFHNNAMPSALAAAAAGKQGKFWEMHDQLFDHQQALDPPALESYAKAIGLNIDKWKRDMADAGLKAEIDAEQALSNKLGARGTPAFFVNGKYLRGAQPFDAFKAKIDEELKNADALIAKGTPVARVYDEIIKNGATEAPAAPAMPPGGARPGQPDPNTRYKVDVAGAPMEGPKDAKVTIAEFSDFQWPFCGRVRDTLKQITTTYPKDVRIAFMFKPLPFHNNAMPSALAAEAANRQGKFWPYHDQLFDHQQALDPPALEGYAKAVGLNVDKWKKDMADPALKAKIEAMSALGDKVGARGTPAFFINGKFLSGAQPFDSFKTAIDAEIKAADELIKKGTPAAKVYDALMKDAKTEVAAAGPPGGGGGVQEGPKAAVPIPVGKSPTKGPKSAPVTIVEFSDFQWPFCGRVGPTLKQIEQTYGNKVQVVWKNFPLPFHNNAEPAAEAAMAAAEQGKFWEFEDKLFANQQALDRPTFERYAQELGLNMDKFKSALDSGRMKALVNEDVQLGNSVGRFGTPTFYVNGRQISGAQPFENFKTVIDDELKKKGG